MGFAKGMAYWLVGVAVSVLFFAGVMVQAYTKYLLLGAMLGAAAVLAHTVKEAVVFSELRLSGREKFAAAKLHAWANIVLTGAWGFLGFVIIYWFKDSLPTLVWSAFLMNEAVYALMMLLPQLILLTYPEPEQD